MVTGIRVNETGSGRPPFENLSTYTRPAFGKQMVFYPVTFTPCSRTSSNGEFKFKQFNQLFLLRFREMCASHRLERFVFVGKDSNYFLE